MKGICGHNVSQTIESQRIYIIRLVDSNFSGHGCFL
jgi:hypothetical protein